MPIGCCYVCRTEGPVGRTRNFLCGNCAHPGEIRVYCARCQIISKADEAGAEKLAELLPTDLEPVPGTTIRIDFCSRCRKASEEGNSLTAEIYSIASN